MSQILAKSPWECFYHLFSSFWEKLIWKISPVVLGEILPVFLTHWLPRARILLKIGRICHFQFKYHSLKKEKIFLKFLFHLSTLHQILNILKKKMVPIANVFPKLQTVKILVRALSKNRCFRKRFDSQHVKVSQILVKSPWGHFSHVFSSFLKKLIWNISLVLLREVLGMFLNTLSADCKYLIEDWENLQLPIQMQLSEKRKPFSQFLVRFLDSTSNSKHFQAKDDGHS